MSSNSMQRPARLEAWRLTVVYVIVFLALAGLLFRLVNLQIVEGPNWLTRAVDNYTNEVSIAAPRGIIYDRNGYILARNLASYNVVITPAELPDDETDIQRIYREVSELTGVPVGGPVTDESLAQAKLYAPCVPGPGIAQLVALQDTNAPYSSVRIRCNVPEDTARVVEEKSVDWPGVEVEVDPIRDYPTGSLTATLVGFLGPIPASLAEDFEARDFVANRDKIGYSGAEDSLQDILAGRNGLRVVQIDVAGQELRNIEPPRATVPGYNVYLTVDTRLQAASEAALLQEINYWNTYFATVRISSGVVIAMNPKTGEILSMVSYPTYENNRMARIIPAYYFEQLSEDPRHPLLNNAISAEFPPGSVFKLTTATGAFNEGVVTLDKIIHAPGQLELCEKFSPNDPCTERNTRPFRDHIYDTNPDGFGQINFLQCIAYSSNVCFYKLSGGFEDEIEGGLGIERIGEYARAIGYGAASGIELKGESDGLIPSPQWKRINTGENWSTGDTYIAGVGQGYVLATPLQILLSGATIANKGRLMQPTIVQEVTDGDGKVREVWFTPDQTGFQLWVPREDADDTGPLRREWINPGTGQVVNQLPEGSYRISPFVPNLKWDITTTPMIQGYTCDLGYCTLLEDELKIVQPETVEAVRLGTRMAVTEPRLGTLNRAFEDFPIPVAGKTGTAEYCDDVARAANRCGFGLWPTHSWTLAYAPYEDPEIIVIAFCYNGGEGASVAAPIVRRVIEAYFELKAIDIAQGGPPSP